MAGDPWDDCTVTVTGYSVSTTSTTTTDYTTCSYSYGIGSKTTAQVDEELKKIKELLKKEVILRMKEDWVKRDKEFKPMPILKPVQRLQNICFNGRGWA